MGDPVDVVLFAACVSLLVWGPLHEEGRRPALALLMGTTTAAGAWLLSQRADLAAAGLVVGAAVGVAFPGWAGRRRRGTRGPLGGGWSGRGGLGTGGASGRW